MKKIRKILAGVAVAATVAFPGVVAAWPAQADPGWQAIVYSGTEDNYYYAWGKSNRDEAVGAALNRCAKYNDDCWVVDSGPEYVSIALNTPYWTIGHGTGATAAEAASNAVADLKMHADKVFTVGPHGPVS